MFLSEKLSQDSIENYFGILRQIGRANENPTISQVLKTSQNVRVVNSIWVNKITGTVVDVRGNLTTWSLLTFKISTSHYQRGAGIAHCKNSLIDFCQIIIITII